MSEQSNVVVFNGTSLSRLAMQNRVLRSLRELGCTVLRVSQDSCLTIEIDAATCRCLDGQGSKPVRRRQGAEILNKVRFAGLEVVWREAA
ncbi:hypothetical protein [Jeongeupia chitinilytica]|uniref:Uncharacterized protein n=1 Tax=Jeongeupia chitinilytica TaxID=1041641 RepID=A0ABQ3H051_9NEIS|nr:hypothetical protein [Jeongeupia chitinilytica]GHD63759.1 hypothetical protein GCM10007350_21890 [Jeongeupia chitinilytica]